jgi:hypothetical protein
MANMHIEAPHAAVQKGIKEWHRIVAESDWDRLPDLLVDEVVFRDPANFEPHHGKTEMARRLRTVFSIMQNFKFLRHFGRETGYVLEFSARVGDANVFGVDLIEFDDEGKITEFTVMMRPASAVLSQVSEAVKRMSAG